MKDMNMYDEEMKEKLKAYAGPEPSVPIPMVKMVDKDGKEICRGYYFRWLTRQPAAFNDFVKPEDVKECVVYSGHADWNMSKDIKIMELRPSCHLEVLDIEDY